MCSKPRWVGLLNGYSYKIAWQADLCKWLDRVFSIQQVSCEEGERAKKSGDFKSQQYPNWL